MKKNERSVDLHLSAVSVNCCIITVYLEIAGAASPSRKIEVHCVTMACLQPSNCHDCKVYEIILTVDLPTRPPRQ